MAPKIYRPLFVFVSSDQRIYALRSPLQICRRLGLMKNVNRSTPAPSIDQIIRVVVKKRSFPGQDDHKGWPPQFTASFSWYFWVWSRAARIVAALQPGCEEMEREWGNEEEMERKWGNGERLTLYISSFSLYFLPLSPFPNSLSISSLSFHFLHQNASHLVAKC